MERKHMDILNNDGLDLIQIYRKGKVAQLTKYKTNEIITD